MPTEIHYWKGSIEWAKVYEPDTFSGSSRWMINFYPDDLEEFRESGCQAVEKEDPNGDIYVRLRRDTQKLMGSSLVKFTPPRLTGEVDVKYVNKLTGEPVYNWNAMEEPDLEYEQVGDRVTLGNGTKATIRVAIFDTQRGKGTRLEGLEITELVKYESETEQSQKAADNNGEASVAKATKAKETKAKKSETKKEAAPWD